MFSFDSCQETTALTPVERRAIPFIMRDGNKHCFSPAFDTLACRYWRGRRSIFITHFKWVQGDKERSISRLEVVDTWVKVHNLINQVAAILTAWEIARMVEITGEPRFTDHVEREEYDGFTDYLGKIQRLHYFLSSFLGNIMPADQSRHAPYIWLERDIPTVERALISDYVDTSLPITTFPFQVIDILQHILADTKQLIHIQDLRNRFEAPVPTYFEGPIGIWRNHINEGVENGDEARCSEGGCLGTGGNVRRQGRDGRGRWIRSIRPSRIIKRLTSPLSSDSEGTVSITRSRSPVVAHRSRNGIDKLEEDLVEDPFMPVDDPFRDPYIFFIGY